jgi:hypothetical protein
VQFQDTDNEWGEFLSLESLEVLNNPPQFLGFTTQTNSVYRGNTVRIYADASDTEQTIESDLSATFYYQHTILGSGWEQTWFATNGQYDGNSFYADFNPPYTADLGSYKFMVEITDTEMSNPYTVGDTIQAFPTDFIEVQNNLPTIVNIKTSSETVRAGVNDRLYLHVNASDGSENT